MGMFVYLLSFSLVVEYGVLFILRAQVNGADGERTVWTRTAVRSTKSVHLSPLNRLGFFVSPCPLKYLLLTRMHAWINTSTDASQMHFTHVLMQRQRKEDAV